jgi:hypothetical protein
MSRRHRLVVGAEDGMSFRPAFIAVVISFSLIVAAFLINRARPRVETAHRRGELIAATAKCADCHSRLQHSVVHEYEMSRHAQKGSIVWTAISRARNRRSRTITAS